jgi:hypothetical protein
MTRHFTAEEANQVLPQVRTLINQILQARQKIIEARPDLMPVLERSIGNGGSKKAGEVIVDFKRLEDGVLALQAMGCVLKDLSTGLVDFPSIRDGREVLLCWQHDEPQVMYWHDLQSGFAGRQRL